jgi:hypothetical protein
MQNNKTRQTVIEAEDTRNSYRILMRNIRKQPVWPFIINLFKKYQAIIHIWSTVNYPGLQKIICLVHWKQFSEILSCWEEYRRMRSLFPILLLNTQRRPPVIHRMVTVILEPI